MCWRRASTSTGRSGLIARARSTRGLAISWTTLTLVLSHSTARANMLCSSPRQLRIVGAPTPSLLEFEDELREDQRSDLAQLHRTEPPLDVRVPQAAVLPAGARLQSGLGVQAPVVAHELLERFSARFERSEIACPLEQPQPGTKVQSVLGAVEGPPLAFAACVLKANPVGVANLAAAAAALADLNSTDRLQTNAHVYISPTSAAWLRRGAGAAGRCRSWALRGPATGGEGLNPPKRPAPPSTPELTPRKRACVAGFYCCGRARLLLTPPSLPWRCSTN